MVERIAILDNEVQARLLSSLLEEKDIPHMLRSYHDSAYDGLFQTELGWGHIEAQSEYRERIEEILADLKPAPSE